MTTYYKATHLDGTDFRTGTINYAGALAARKVVTHPGGASMVPNKPGTYLSVSVEPAETLIGGSWPCRLFRVEPIGPILDRLAASKYKRACIALRVVEELPAWQALGPNGERVAAVIDRTRQLTPDEAKRMVAAWDAAWDAAQYATWAAARGTGRGTGRGAAWDAVWGAVPNAVPNAVRGAARDAARDAALAELVRDLITPDQYETLAGPFNSIARVTA